MTKYVKCLKLLKATIESRDELSDVEKKLIQLDIKSGSPRNSIMIADGSGGRQVVRSGYKY